MLSFRGDFIAALVKRGHRVIAVAPSIPASVRTALEGIGSETRQIEITNTSLNPLTTIGTLSQIRGLIRECKPDVLMAYTIKPVILAAIAGRAERVEKVISLITGVGYAFTSGREMKRRMSRLIATILYRVALSWSDEIIFQNKDDRALFRRLRIVSKKRISRLVNGSGINLVKFTPAEMPAGVSFLMIARLLKDKGIREFAAAAARLKNEYPDVPIVLVGRLDPSPDSVSQRELGQILDSGIEYKGELADVRPAIANCSVFVLPSYREGTPRSVLEAMAMGRAIITTDAPGCRETVRPADNGYLVPPRDADALYEAMLRFVTNPTLAAKMGKISREIAENKYDVRRVNAKLIEYSGL